MHETDDEAEAIWRDAVGVPPRAHPAAGRRQLLEDGRHRPVRARARRSSSTRARPTAPTADRPSAAPSGSSRSGTSSSCSTTATPTATTERAAPAEHRHRSRPRAHPARPPGRRLASSTPTSSCPCSRRPSRSPAPPTARDERDRRRPADHGRPRPGHVHAGGRRGAPGQRGPGLRAAPDHPPGRPPGPPARASTAPCTERLVDAAVGVLGAAYPGLAEQHHLIVDVVGREEEGVPPHAGHRLDHPRGGSWPSGGATRPGRRGLPAARHLRVPGRAHRRDRRGGRVVGRPRRASSAAMDRQRSQARAAARAGGPTAGDEAYRSVLDTEGQTVFVGQRPTATRPRPGWWPCWPTTTPTAPARSRSSSTAPPSTPRAAARSATSGPSSPRRARPWSTTRCRPLPGLTSHRATVTGEIFAGQDALATIDGPRREAAAPQPHRHPPAPRRPADACSATTCASRARWSPRTGCASTSATTAPSRPRSWPR